MHCLIHSCKKGKVKGSVGEHTAAELFMGSGSLTENTFGHTVLHAVERKCLTFAQLPPKNCHWTATPTDKIHDSTSKTQMKNSYFHFSFILHFSGGYQGEKNIFSILVFSIFSILLFSGLLINVCILTYKTKMVNLSGCISSEKVKQLF